jgi:hypothetical protein
MAQVPSTQFRQTAAVFMAALAWSCRSRRIRLRGDRVYSGGTDEEGARLFAHCCDHRRVDDRHLDGCLRLLARPGMGRSWMERPWMGVERSGMGARRCRRRRWRRGDCRRHHCLPAARIRRLSRLCRAALRTGLLLGIAAGLRWLGSRRRLYRATGAGLPGLRCGCAASGCGRASSAGCHITAEIVDL